MNVTEKIFSDEDYRKKYYARLEELNAQKNMFVDFTKRMKEISEKNNKTEGKKRRRAGVLVNGATSKESIRRLKGVLRQRMAEVLAEDGDMKLKQLQVNELSNKIAALDRVLSQIERIEREKLADGQNKQNKQKKGRTEAVYLSSDDLTVNKNGVASYQAALAGTAQSAAAPQQGAAAGVDVLAGYGAEAEVLTEAAVDFQV